MTTDNTTRSPYFLALDVLEDEASYEQLQEYQATTTPQLYLNNTKMARVMKRKRYEFNELITVGIGGQLKDTEGNQRAGQVAFAIYPPQEAGTEPRELDGDDFHIYDIVSTLVLAGNNFLTASMIDRAMNGVTGTKQVSETRQREIRERLGPDPRLGPHGPALRRRRPTRAAHLRRARPGLPDPHVLHARPPVVRRNRRGR